MERLLLTAMYQAGQWQVCVSPGAAQSERHFTKLMCVQQRSVATLGHESIRMKSVHPDLEFTGLLHSVQDSVVDARPTYVLSRFQTFQS
jgi:hypothetical protein